MERRAFQTPEGEVWLRGEMNPAKPLLLVLRGAFAPANLMARMPEAVPEASVLFADIPGNRCPLLIDQSVSTYAAAYDDALRQIGRPVVVCGASLGGVTALAMRTPAAVIALDPPVRTALWPLTELWRPALRDNPEDAELRDFLWGVFGLTETAHEERDYLPLMREGPPAQVIFGEEPLKPPRRLAELPSLVSDDTRAALAALPRMTTTVAPGVGHDIGRGASRFIVAAIRRCFDYSHVYPEGGL